ncbi:Predicted metal-dependent hydrolase, TIM-barrel fold [Pseudomonas sp. NFACC02]|uniref:amidohydrolase family protein n=1 Tax=Pseudomonas sp. NFACC02 TaxID=1566250 RepID=UPI0008CAA310|nr:amidohydrolase family protein [Pseudomonas sp. NFACC02]SEQ31522.1 Predicted metal-dependent hydrolase, TIM-barrel fold [Pseudomonas sp. NFACC02]
MSDTFPASILGIDGHAHVFSRELDLTSTRRYSPDYDATLAMYQNNLQGHGLSHGVLVQPSFLGTDNRYLLNALRQAPEQMRGVVVVERDISRNDLDEMDRLGVVGIRLNLMGKALPDFSEPQWAVLFGHIAELDWHVELHRHVVDLPALIRALMPFGVKVVIDHFGRPDARLGLDQPGFREMLELGLGGSLWMKVSGIYRLEGSEPENLDFARAALPLLVQSFGQQRLVWGSDWPHTQHEARVKYGSVVEQLRALECSPQMMRSLLIEAPQVLFDFAVVEA